MQPSLEKELFALRFSFFSLRFNVTKRTITSVFQTFL